MPDILAALTAGGVIGHDGKHGLKPGTVLPFSEDRFFQILSAKVDPGSHSDGLISKLTDIQITAARPPDGRMDETQPGKTLLDHALKEGLAGIGDHQADIASVLQGQATEQAPPGLGTKVVRQTSAVKRETAYTGSGDPAALAQFYMHQFGVTPQADVNTNVVAKPMELARATELVKPMEAIESSDATGLGEVIAGQGEAIMGQDAPVKKAVSWVAQGVRERHEAATSASRGQMLPHSMVAAVVESPATTSGKSLEQGKSSGVEAAMMTISMPHEKIQDSEIALPSTATDAGHQGDVSAVRPFDQFLHPAEVKLHASLESPLRSPVFPTELADKVVWLAGRHSQVAELSLNPPQLGSVEVRLSLSGGDAGAQFYSHNPVVREALEAALPRLRELMADAGISLGNASVRDEAFPQGEKPETAARSLTGGDSRGGLAAINEGVLSLVPRSGLGLVDLYI